MIFCAARKNLVQVKSVFWWKTNPFSTGCTRRKIMRPEDMASKSAWNSFYSESDENKLKHFDWFLSFSQLYEHIKEFFPVGKTPKVLDVGCGTSDFAFELFHALNSNCYIDCVDFSLEAVNQMKDASKDIQKMNSVNSNCGVFYQVADAKNLPFAACSFDCVFDKGTTDSILRDIDGESKALQVLSEELRVLRNKGKLIQISDESMELRMSLLYKAVARLHVNGEGYSIKSHWKSLGVHYGMEYNMFIIQKQGIDQ